MTAIKTVQTLNENEKPSYVWIINYVLFFLSPKARCVVRIATAWIETPFNKICPPLTLLSHISQYKTGWINKRYERERYDVYERCNGNAWSILSTWYQKVLLKQLVGTEVGPLFC